MKTGRHLTKIACMWAWAYAGESGYDPPKV